MNEGQPIGDELGKDVGVHHDDEADDGRERHGVPEDETKDGALVANLVGGGGGDANGLGVNHFSHDAAGTVCGAHENGAEMKLLSGYSLQTAKESV